MKELRINQWPISLRDVPKLLYYFTNGIKYHLAGRYYLPKPAHAALHVTRRCNARCVMCSDWKRHDGDRELTLSEIEETFKNRLFNSLETLALTGGEPTMREDLVEIAQALLKCCPQLKGMLLFSNGLDPDLLLETVQEILSLPDCSSLEKFTISISLDGCGEIHQKIRGFPQAFDRVVESIKRLKELQQKIPFHLCSTCVVQPLNLDNVTMVAKLGQELNLPINFIPVWISNDPLEESAEEDTLRLNHRHLENLKSLLEQHLQPCLTLSNIILWQEYFKMAGGESRRLPCFLTHRNVYLDSEGTMYICSVDDSLIYGNIHDKSPDEMWYSKEARRVRGKAKKQVCPNCILCCNVALSLREEYFCAAGLLIKEKLRGMLGV